MAGGVRWTEVDTLYGESATAREFSTRLNEDGTTRVQFGDGVTGARLPTGTNNLVATYRVGSGVVGRVGADVLTTALDRPKGLSAVTNPLAADGGADAQTLEDARTNAPRSVITFGRAVSLQDFETLVAETGEVMKASAIWLYDGLERVIHLTISAAEGAEFSDDALRRLGTSLDTVRDVNHRLRLANFTRVPIRVYARVHVKADYAQADVQEAARDALDSALSFDALHLGQSIHASDIYRTLQDVEGVDHVDLLTLLFKLPPYADATLTAPALAPRTLEMLASGALNPVQPHLRIFTARPDAAHPGQAIPAEIAWIDAADTDLVVDASGGLSS
jgi:predicted phage baseplate assembly protein